MTQTADISTPIAARLSCNIPDIYAITPATWADALIRRVSPGMPQTIHAASLPAYASKAVIYDLRHIIEQDMLAMDTTQASYEIVIGDATARLDVVFCALQADDESFLDSAFLSSSTAQIISSQASAIVSSIMTDEPASISIATDAKTYRGIQAGSPFASANSWTIPIQGLKLYLDSPDESIRAVRIDCGRRSKTFYVSDDEPDIALLFKNEFLAVEYFEARAKITTTRDVSRQTAATARRLQAYDIQDQMSITVEISNLSRQEAMTMQQAVAASTLFINCDKGSGMAIVTESTLEFDNDDSEPRSVKFSFLFSDPRPRLPRWRLDQMLRSQFNIFKAQYAPEFS